MLLWLNGYVNDKIAQFICNIHNVDGKSLVDNYTVDELINISSSLINTEFNINGLYDMEQAQVTAGGVSLDEVNPSNMESKLVKNVYFIGEVLDLDALTGGFNLQIAWSTAYAAGNNIK